MFLLDLVNITECRNDLWSRNSLILVFNLSRVLSLRQRKCSIRVFLTVFVLSLHITVGILIILRKQALVKVGGLLY